MAASAGQTSQKQMRDGRSASLQDMVVAAELPWGAQKLIAPLVVDLGSQPGQFAAQTLFVDFVTHAERKIQQVLQEKVDKSLTKSLQRGEDASFDQILTALSGLAEHCLPSILRSLIVWYDQQYMQIYAMMQHKSIKQDPPKNQPAKVAVSEREMLIEKRGLAVDFIFCLVLIEVLKQLHLHPGYEDHINHIINISFKRFHYKSNISPNASNALVISDLFAEVIGVVAASRFHMVRNKFMADLQELRSKEQTSNTVQQIISLLMGVKFFRVKMHLMEEFEMSMGFLHELGTYFLEVKEKDIKHALAGLFTEILLPVAASVRTEVNVPALKNFVDLLYSHTLDLASKRKYTLVAYPLLTCLLCISQKQFFLTNWHYFLTLCLSNLKNRDPKISRGALESLYRLLWVYVIRLKCESNTATHSRLQAICTSLFPRGGRTVIPRDNPLNIFVKIVHFIGQERLDFAFKEIIYDLLCVGRPIRAIYAERMNIGLRSLLVIADSLQQQDGPPAMPRSIGVLPSGNTIRVKKTYLTRPLSNETARNIGLDIYYAPCRRAFDGILRALDLQVGRPLMMTLVQTSNKEPDDLLGGERKPKLDLFQTCIAAVPRLLPEGMSQTDLIDLISRMTVHMNDQLRQHSCQTLHNLITECPDSRDDVILGFLQFVGRDLQDGFPQLLDSALKLLHGLLSTWKSVVVPQVKTEPPVATPGPANRPGGPRVQVSPLLKSDNAALVLHCVEGMALAILCQGRSLPRRIAIFILKEVKSLLEALCGDDHEPAMLDVLDSACDYVLSKYILHVSKQERDSWRNNSALDFSWLCEKLTTVETDVNLVNSQLGNEYLQWDAWACALSGFCEGQFIPQQCPTAAAYAWPLAYTRITACYPYVDPNNPQNDTRASLLRSSKSKASWSMCGETLNYSNYLSLWQKYLVLTCALAPPTNNTSTVVRSVSPVNSCGGENSDTTSRPTELRIPRLANVSAVNLFKLFVPLLRCEMTDMRDIVVLGLASCNPASFTCLLDELAPLFRDAAEKKQENVRRRKRRDLLRLQLVRLVEIVAFRNSLPCANMRSGNGPLKPVLLDFLDNARQFVESDLDRDAQTFASLRLHYCKMCNLIIKHFPVEKRVGLLPQDRRQPLFFQLMAWCSRLCHTDKTRNNNTKDSKDDLNGIELQAVSALCSVISCGPIFDPLKSISDDGYLYRWLDPFVASHNQQVASVVEETLVSLLDFNPDVSQLLDWVIDCCYTAPSRVANKCFRALATIFGNREYPCDIAAMFNLTLMFSGYAVQEMNQLAVQLMQILEEHFFGDGHRFSQIRENLEEKLGLQTHSDNDARFAKSQMFLSQKMAELHPDMTMPIFSEISARLMTARPARRASMLTYLLPWLHNSELVDPNMESGPRSVSLSLGAKMAESHAVASRVLKGEGWGTTHATEMILNNLMFVTVKFGDEHVALLEQIWVGLIAHWPQNLRVIIRYLSVMTTLAPDTLLPYAQRIVVYLARVSPERLVEELIDELQIMDTFRNPLGRAENPPYFRWIRKADDESKQMGVEDRDGVIHTRRATPCESESAALGALDEALMGEPGEPSDPGASMASLVTLKADILNAKPPCPIDEKARPHLQPFQLPMPAYGGYYCSLGEYMPSNDQPIVAMHRNNLAVVLLCDLVIADVDIEWMVHLPLLLHMAVLGVDHCRPLVHDHCKRLLLNLIVTQSSGSVNPSKIASILLRNQLATSGALVSRHSSHDPHNQDRYFDSVSSEASTALMGDDGVPIPVESSHPRMRKTDIQPKTVVILASNFDNLQDMVSNMINYLASKMGEPLWTSEDVTARCWRSASGEHMSTFVTNLATLFGKLKPVARVEPRWAQTALHVALCCSNRHLAGRSFQVVRALRVAPTSNMLSDMLARLVETVCESGEDMQGYVTEIMLTLDSVVLNMEVAEHSLASLFRGADGEQDTMPPANHPGGHSPGHCRSTSYSVAMVKRLSPAFERKDQRLSLNATTEDMQSGHLPRSKSAQVLKSVPEGQEEHVAALSQLFWIAVSMLESDFEHEFLLALHLLDKLLDLPGFERQECLDRLDRMVKQLNWTNFPGTLALVLKGCIFASSFEFMAHVLTKLIQVVDLPAVAPDQRTGFALIGTVLLPYMVFHYDNPSKLCITAADSIVEYCSGLLSAQQSEGEPGGENPVEHLSTVMRLYSKRTFNRDCYQWTKCTVKYLSDACQTQGAQLLVVLCELLERGPPAMQHTVLQIMLCVFQHTDLQTAQPITVNGDFLKCVSRHVQSTHWREATRILKLAVGRSSSLPDPNQANRDQPGRTLDFHVDMPSVLSVSYSNAGVDASPKKHINDVTLRKPWVAQIRVREHLVNLLNASGLRVGLPKSPSVIFSQSSHDVGAEMPSSVYSSSGDIHEKDPSTPTPDGNQTDYTSDSFPRVFKEFDFLEAEHDSMSESADSCFNWMATMRPRSISNAEEEDTGSNENVENTVSSSATSEKDTHTDSDSESEEEDEGSIPNTPPSIERLFVNACSVNDQTNRPISPASSLGRPGGMMASRVSLCGSVGTPNAEWAVTSFPLFGLECCHHSTGQVEEVWGLTANDVFTDQDGTATANATLVFSQLYRESCMKVCGLLRDACHFLGMSPNFKDISMQFMDAMDLLTRSGDVPYVFVTPNLLRASGVLQRQKFNVLDVREHYETFLERKEHCIRTLNGVKSSLKLQLMGQKVEESNTSDQEMELCRTLHKLFFQLLLMCEGYVKIAQLLTTKIEEQQANVSSEVMLLQRELLCAVNELSGSTDLHAVSVEVGQSPLTSLVQLLQNRDVKQTVRQLRCARNQSNKSEIYGCCQEVDVDVLLLLYCKSASEALPGGCFAIVGSESALLDNCMQLRETNIQLKGSVNQLTSSLRTPRSSINSPHS